MRLSEIEEKETKIEKREHGSYNRKRERKKSSSMLN